MIKECQAEDEPLSCLGAIWVWTVVRAHQGEKTESAGRTGWAGALG